MKQQVISPLDILILLKITTFGDTSWHQQELADALDISQSEVSKSLQRSKYAGLIGPNTKHVMRMALMEFLQHGVRYTFPQKPGPMVRGVPTAHAAPPLSEDIQSSEAYVWPYAKGEVRGQSILPLYPTIPKVCQTDHKLYELLTLVDAIRVGRAREKAIAIQELKERLTHGKQDD